MIVETFLNVLLSLSISGSILFGIWVLLRYFFKEKLSRRLQYYLLLIVLLRFLIPFSANQSLVGKLFSSFEDTPIYEMIYGSPEQRNPTVFIGDNVVFGSDIQIGKKKSPVDSYILYVWLTIALALFVQKVTKYQSFRKYLKADWRPIDDPVMLDCLSQLCEDKKISNVPELYTTKLVSSPLLLGLRKSYIVLPHENLTSEQLYSVLAHELTHYRAKDLFYKWFVQSVVCLHWFNPVIYRLAKLVNQECEYACDEATIRNFTNTERYNYGATLIELAKTSGTYNEKVASVTLYENANELSNRLQALVAFQKNRQPRRLTSSFVLITLIVLAFLLGAYKSPVTDKNQTISESKSSYVESAT